MHYLKVLLGVLIFPVFLSGQTVLEGGLFLGVANYQGDLARSSGIQIADNNMAAGLMARHYLDSTFALRANFIYGKLSGSDFEHSEQVSRGFSFTNDIIELSIVGEFEPLGKYRFRAKSGLATQFSPYLFAGIGGVLINPETDYGSISTIKQTADANADYSSIQLVIPFGIGAKITINDSWLIGLEGGLRNPYSDYLDGVSESGNPDANDWYSFAGATLMYRLK